MPERMTKDLHILIHQRDREEALSRLRNAGYRVASQLSIAGVIMHFPESVEVDVLFGTQPWLEEAFQNVCSDEAGYPVISLPYLILMKMNARETENIGGFRLG